MAMSGVTEFKGRYQLGGYHGWASQVALVVKNPYASAGEARAWSLGWEDPLEEGMATHSSILAWRIPWTEEPGRLESMGTVVEVGMQSCICDLFSV